MRLGPGEILANRFLLEREAGEGGMATVYRAQDLQTGEPVALKLLDVVSNTQGEQERFVREAELLSELRHPAVVAYRAHGRAADGRLFLAMEWLDGEDLAQRLLRGPLSRGEALSLLLRVSEALAVAHARGVIHRDLKPANLFLHGGQVERAKLLDFGIARQASSQRALTRTGLMIGTPEYMAPEQARGERTVTPAADVFALGCVLYECLVGAPPFKAEHLSVVLFRILLEEPPPLATRCPGIPLALEALVQRMLSKNAAERLPDAGALCTALRDVLEHIEQTDAYGQGQGPPRASLRLEQPFAATEQALATVVIAEVDTPFSSDGEGADVSAQARRRASLLTAIRMLGARAEFLVNEMLLVTIADLGNATDQASLAARTALLIKERWPESEVAVVTGRGSANGATVVGEVADRATQILKQQARCASAAAPSGVWLDDLSARLLGSSFVIHSNEGTSVLVAEEKDTDATRPLLGRPTPCVGRDAELGNLEGQVTSCIEESEARVVLVTAPPGVGKSRLRHEFMRRIERRSEPITLLFGRADLLRGGAGCGVVGSGLRRLCGIAGDEPVEQQRLRLRERLLRLVPVNDHQRILFFLGELALIPFSAEGDPAIFRAARQDPKLMREQLHKTFVEWVRAEAESALVLFICDDLHWGDALSVSLLDQALRDLSGLPLFVLGFARPEIHDVHPKIWQRHRLQEIPLKGLSRKACERLIQQILGKQVPPGHVARAVDQAAGNALFLEEIIRAIAGGEDDEQPATVVAMLQARIGRIEPGARRVLRAASIFGQTFWTDGVEALLGLTQAESELTSWLKALVEAELIQQQSGGARHDVQEYCFRHALVREAAYGLLTPGDIAAGHRMAGTFLTSLAWADPAVIAEHFELGGDRASAARFYMKAAERSLERGSNQDTLRLAMRGQSCGPDTELLAQLRSIEGLAAMWLNDLDRAERIGLGDMQGLRPGSTGWYRTLLSLMIARFTTDQEADGADLASLLISTEPDSEAVASCLETTSTLIRPLANNAAATQLQGLLRLAEQCTARLENEHPLMARHLLYCRAVIAYYRSPRLWTMVQDVTRACELAHRAGDTGLELGSRTARLERGWFELGDRSGAEERLLALEPVVATCQNAIAPMHWRLGLAHVLCAREDEEACERAAELIEPMLAQGSGLHYLLATAHGLMARIKHQRRQLAQAADHADAALQSFERAPLHMLDALITAIQIALEQRCIPRAVSLAERGLRTLHCFGSGGVSEVELRLYAAEAFYSSGDVQRAHRELGEALHQIRLRADDIAEPSWRVSYLTRNAACRRAQELARSWGIGAKETTLA